MRKAQVLEVLEDLEDRSERAADYASALRLRSIRLEGEAAGYAKAAEVLRTRLNIE